MVVPQLRSLWLAHDSREAANVITGDKFDEDIPPAVVMRHGVVELRRDSTNFGQAAARHLNVEMKKTEIKRRENIS